MKTFSFICIGISKRGERERKERERERKRERGRERGHNVVVLNRRTGPPFKLGPLNSL